MNDTVTIGWFVNIFVTAMAICTLFANLRIGRDRKRIAARTDDDFQRTTDDLAKTRPSDQDVRLDNLPDRTFLA